MIIILVLRLSSVGSSSHSQGRDEMNLAEVVEDVAVQAIRGVQMDIRWGKIEKNILKNCLL